MKKAYYFTALFTGALVALATPSRAQDATPPPSASSTASGPESHGDWQADYLKKMGEALGLTDAQLAQIKTILQTGEGQFKSIRQDTSLAEDQKSTQLGALRDNLHQQISAVLTPGQQEKFTSFWRQFQAHREQHRR